MLINRSGDEPADHELTLGSVHNYYERLVLDALERDPVTAAYSQDLLADLLCLALNRLPARYVRHDVDTAFYLTQEERVAMHTRINQAVQDAIAQIAESPDTRL